MTRVAVSPEWLRWYREFSLTVGVPEAGFVGSAALDRPPEDVVAEMARITGLTWISPYEMLRRERPRFVLGPAPAAT